MARHPEGPRLGLSAAGYYEVRWTADGRSRRETTGSRDFPAAQQFLAAWLFRQGKQVQTAPAVSVVVDTYLAERGMAATSREGYAAVELNRILGRLTVDAITADKVIAYRVARSGVADATVRRELSVLIAAVNHATKQRRIPAGMVPVIALPASTAPKTSTFTPGQVDILIAMTAPKDGERMSRLHRFIWIAMETASRRAAVETLKWDQVDLLAGTIKFQDEGPRVRKKKRRVPVPISSRLRPALWRMMAEKTGPLVLDGDTEIYQAWIALMKRAAKWTGDDSYLGKVPHDLRRTWATLAAGAGVSLWDIAGILGDSMAMVSKHYAHHVPDYLRSAVNYRDDP